MEAQDPCAAHGGVGSGVGVDGSAGSERGGGAVHGAVVVPRAGKVQPWQPCSRRHGPVLSPLGSSPAGQLTAAALPLDPFRSMVGGHQCAPPKCVCRLYWVRHPRTVQAGCIYPIREILNSEKDGARANSKTLEAIGHGESFANI